MLSSLNKVIIISIIIKPINHHHDCVSRRFVTVRHKQPINIQYLDRHVIRRSAYSMLIDIHCIYVDWNTVYQARYTLYMSIDINALMYLDRNTVCRKTYSMSFEWYVCRSTVVTNCLTHISLASHFGT